ncbi:hypothetical protein [Vibrio antiquarius]|uniref:hypothetical protein n=1 Tax=Vibrio antiquarius (strain Ex25) TaxID=150340 RepID=UPI00265963DE|nr:hypothetical protein [Vibrio antiquarius]MCS0022784.1 hypothetical protein [Vibrio antiquarius]
MFARIQDSFLRQPFLDFSDKAQRVRGRLLFASFLSTVLAYYEISVTEISTAGLKLDGLTSQKLYSILSWIVIYYFVYFLWCSIDEFWKWRLKLVIETSDNEALRKTSCNSYSQAQLALDENLYSEKNAELSIKNSMTTALRMSINQAKLDNGSFTCDEDTLKNVIERAWELTSFRGNLSSDLKRVKRYEKSYLNYHWQEFLRTAVLEIGIPLIFGIIALYMLDKAGSTFFTSDICLFE